MYNEIIKSQQFRQHNESMEEWIGRFNTVAMECNHEEVDRQ